MNDLTDDEISEHLARLGPDTVGNAAVVAMRRALHEIRRRRDEHTTKPQRIVVDLSATLGALRASPDLAAAISELVGGDQGAENEFLRRVLSWIDTHEPELVAQAEAKFDFRLARDEAPAP